MSSQIQSRKFKTINNSPSPSRERNISELKKNRLPKSILDSLFKNKADHSFHLDQKLRVQFNYLTSISKRTLVNHEKIITPRKVQSRPASNSNTPSVSNSDSSIHSDHKKIDLKAPQAFLDDSFSVSVKQPYIGVTSLRSTHNMDN